MSDTNYELDKNKSIISKFEDDLKNNGLSTKTIKSHIGNLDFFVPTFLTMKIPNHYVKQILLM